MRDDHQNSITLFFNEGCQEDNEVNWNLPLRFDELEVEELQASVLEACGVVQGFQQFLTQEEWPHSPQELRTILFEERGVYVCFQGDHFHSLNSTSR